MNPHDAAAVAAAPRVSVVIPFRNAGRTIAETVESVRRQSFGDWELIAVDDRSTDDSRAIVAACADADDRIRVIDGPGLGVSAARNAGVAAARGVLIAFLDADDLWLPTKLALHVQRFERETDLGLAFDRVRFVAADGTPTPVRSRARGSRIRPDALLYENPACTASTLVMRRRTFAEAGGFDIALAHAEDLELMLRVACRTAWRVSALPAVLTHYRASPDGASADLHRMFVGWHRVMQRARRYAPDLVARHLSGASAAQLRYLARRSLRLGQSPRMAASLMWMAWRSSPWALLREPYRSFGTTAAAVWHVARSHPLGRAAR